MKLENTLLSAIHSPVDLRKLSREQLPELATEIRNFMLDVVSVNPGHVGSSLGVVELTIALHYLFDTPTDKLIWDVGHQAYAHKILTGRRDVFDTLRQLNGISGFPVMTESAYDAFGTGHSSTALSAALGMAFGAQLQKINRQHIAVVGDGAITGGMFFEALNQAGDSPVDLIIVLNDNGIAIDKSSGVLKDYLIRQKNDLTSNPLFEAFNIQCSGPVDGNDFDTLLPALEKIKSQKGVRLLHLITKKGKGFSQAEAEQILYHAPGKFDRQTGTVKSIETVNKLPLYQVVFGETLLELAKQNDKIVAITPAMPTGSHLIPMMEQFPERTFDVGIAEQHAVTFAAGLAAEGFVPFCVIYSTFLQRAYDQLIHDVAIQNLPVIFCIDRAGLVGEDGATHHGVFDLAFLNCIPNMTIAAPMDEIEFRNMLFSAQQNPKGPIAIRYPRGKATTSNWRNHFETIPLGQSRILHEGKNTAVITIGQTGNAVAQAANKLEKENIEITHVDLRFLKPLDTKTLHAVFTTYSNIITVEDGAVKGGLGSVIAAFAFENNFSNHNIRSLGVPDTFIKHGHVDELHALCGFDVKSIVEVVKEFSE
ncbi:MAG: 1-deoxy-D-xylulose-5-phosphate synthase [Lentimicrobiaceae bacterium]|jgi:1-deoxy-D-xylulose-5-phosphate synthase|nr:1-deoxy-D-xylulose-5-phosphate synthase [Lentimicrobiaceae bacterium]